MEKENNNSYNDVYEHVLNYTKGFTAESGSIDFVDRPDMLMAKSILEKYYDNVNTSGIDYDKKEKDGVNYVITFDTPKNIEEGFAQGDELKYMPNKAPTAGPLAGGVVGGGMAESVDEELDERLYLDKKRKALANAGFKVDGLCAEEILNLYQDVCGIEPYDRDKVIKKYDLQEALNELVELDEELNSESGDIYDADEVADLCESKLNEYNLIEFVRNDNVFYINYNKPEIKEIILDDMPGVDEDELDDLISIGIELKVDPQGDSDFYNDEDVDVIEVSLSANDYDFEGFNVYFNYGDDDNEEQLNYLKENLDDYLSDEAIIYNVKEYLKERMDDDLDECNLVEDKHEELNPDLYENNEMKPEVKEKLNAVVNNFVDKLKEDEIELDVKDVVVIGSNANYNYNDHSDIDLHIVADTSVYPNKEDLAMKCYQAYKTLFNNKYDPTIYGHEVEVYVEPDAIKANSNGMYSLNNGWIKVPEKEEIPEVDQSELNEVLKPFLIRYDEADSIEKIDALIDDLYLLRQKSILQDGEYGIGNLAFKEFRNKGYLQDLKDKKANLENKEMSLEKLSEELVIEPIDMNANGKHYFCKISEPDGNINYYETEEDAEEDLARLNSYYNKNKLLEEDEMKINIEVIVEPNVEEALPSGNVEDIYDEQTLEDWYDFAATIEGIIERNGKTVNINLSKNPTSLSEYIDFYLIDKDGNKQPGMIDLRLSDHSQTSNARNVRKRHASKLDPDFRLKSVIVNNKQFNSYEEAIDYIKEMFNMDERRLTEEVNIDKTHALANHLGYEKDSMVDSDDDQVFTTYDDSDYLVLTKEEAYNRAVEEIKNIFDDLGLDSFTPNFQRWILDNAIDDTYFREWAEENNEEEPDNYIDPDEAMLVFKEIYGEDELTKALVQHNGIDLDKVAEEAIRQDGVAHFISYYDGKEIDLGNGLYAYRIN